jgi:hypothetical protein
MPSLHGKLHHFPGASVDLTDPRIGILLPDLVMARCGGIDRMLFAEALETTTRASGGSPAPPLHPASQ